MKMKYLVIALFLALVAAGLVFWFAPKGGQADAQQAQQARPPVEVGVVTIAPQAVTFSKDLPGRTSAFRVAEIRPQVSGIILKRQFDEGSEVTEGQPLYQIDPAPYQAAHDSAQADLLKAEANVKSVQAKSSRYAQLVKIGGVSKQDYDDVTASLEQSKADVAIATAALTTAKINLDYTQVFSPIAGRIGQSLVTEGALVTANQAAPLATVQQFDKVYVDVTQSSDELMRLRRQFASTDANVKKPSAHLLIDGQIYGEPGELQFSDVMVNPGTGTVQLRILFSNPQHEILPGLFVHARLEQSHDAAAILVPQQSVSRNADGSVTVWVVGADNKVGIRPITVSDVIGDQWRVTSGLNAGDRVIVAGTMKVQPGAEVKTVEQKPAEQTAPAAESEMKAPPVAEGAQPVEQNAPAAVESPATTEQPAPQQDAAPAPAE